MKPRFSAQDSAISKADQPSSSVSIFGNLDEQIRIIYIIIVMRWLLVSLFLVPENSLDVYPLCYIFNRGQRCSQLGDRETTRNNLEIWTKLWKTWRTRIYEDFFFWKLRWIKMRKTQTWSSLGCFVGKTSPGQSHSRSCFVKKIVWKCLVWPGVLDTETTWK